jgi:hypothetical protein
MNLPSFELAEEKENKGAEASLALQTAAGVPRSKIQAPKYKMQVPEYKRSFKRSEEERQKRQTETRDSTSSRHISILAKYFSFGKTSRGYNTLKASYRGKTDTMRRSALKAELGAQVVQG